jgi:hypothetical protein
MGSAPSKRADSSGSATKADKKQAAAKKPVVHPGNEERPWGDDPEQELKAALGGLVQVLSSSMGWTWAMVVEVTDEGVAVQYGDRTRMLAWDVPSKVNPGSLEWMDVLRNAMPIGAMMEIMSASFGGWVPGKIVRAAPDQVVFQYGERAKLVRIGDPDDPADLVMRRATEEKLQQIARKREHMELRLKCDTVREILSEEEQAQLDLNLDELDRLASEYEDKRGELTDKQRDTFELELRRNRERACPQKLLDLAIQKRKDREAEEQRRLRKVTRTIPGSIFTASFASSGVQRAYLKLAAQGEQG